MLYSSSASPFNDQPKESKTMYSLTLGTFKATLEFHHEGTFLKLGSWEKWIDR
jgi:hypothetical protein